MGTTDQAFPSRGNDLGPGRQRNRKHPAHGVYISPTQPTIVFLTVTTLARKPWLTSHANHLLLRSIWRHATSWFVGRYVLMPDHIHLFASPGEPELPLDKWVRYWKSQFSKKHGNPEHRWQTDHWDTRLRREETYDAKWEYVVHNPVRRGLAAQAEDWPFQGELFELRW